MKKYELLKIKNPEKKSIREKSLIAKENGFDGLILLKQPSSSFESYLRNVEDLKTDLDLVKGIEINEKELKPLRSKIARYRSKVNFLAINGGKEKINRFSVEDKRVDLLFNQTKPNNRGINHIYSKLAKKNQVGIGFNLKKLLTKKGYTRAKIIRNLIKNKEIVTKNNSPVVFSTFSENKYQLKRERELKNLIGLLDFDSKDLKNSYKFIEERTEFNRKHKKPVFFEKGVEVIEDPAPDS